MNDNESPAAPWGRAATLLIAAGALMAGQFVSLAALAQWYGIALRDLQSIGGDGVAVALIIVVSTPVQTGLLLLFAQRGVNPLLYLGLVPPTRSQIVFGVLAIVALIVVANGVSMVFGRDIVTRFQIDIYRTAGTAGMLPLLWFAVVVAAPVGEEILFRGFLYRGWLRQPRDVWAVIVATAALFALLHVQYDWFVTAQIFIFGLLLGWMRWASGSTLLTILLHALINLEGMIETVIASQ